MLILTRRIGEKIMIGNIDEVIEVAVLGVHGGQVRIGIDAPDNIPVHREEIFNKIESQKKEGSDA